MFACNQKCQRNSDQYWPMLVYYCYVPILFAGISHGHFYHGKRKSDWQWQPGDGYQLSRVYGHRHRLRHSWKEVLQGLTHFKNQYANERRIGRQQEYINQQPKLHVFPVFDIWWSKAIDQGVRKVLGQCPKCWKHIQTAQWLGDSWLKGS